MSQSVAYAEPFGQLKSASVEQQPKGNATEFTISSGDCKSSANGQKLPNIQAASSVRAANMDYRGHFELGFDLCKTSLWRAMHWVIFGLCSSTFGPHYATIEFGF